MDKSGTFSVKSAYNSIAKHGQEGRSWQAIWKINIPQRCKFHMWVSLHDRLLKNESLYDRHLYLDGVCGVCKTNIENLCHALRNCVKAREFWLKLGVSIHDLDFWESDAQTWLESNLKLSRRADIENWKAIFCVGCWLIWRRINEVVHHGSCSSVDEGMAEAMCIVRCMVRAKKFIDGHESFLMNGRLSQVVESSQV